MTSEEIKELITKHLGEARFGGEKGAISQYEASRCIEEYTPNTCVEIVHDILTMLIDYIDYEDVQKICSAMDNCSTVDVAAWTLDYYTRVAPQGDRLTGKQIARALYYNISHDEYIKFFNEVQKWTKKALEEMGENTDV